MSSSIRDRLKERKAQVSQLLVGADGITTWSSSSSSSQSSSVAPLPPSGGGTTTTAATANKIKKTTTSVEECRPIVAPAASYSPTTVAPSKEDTANGLSLTAQLDTVMSPSQSVPTGSPPVAGVAVAVHQTEDQATTASSSQAKATAESESLEDQSRKRAREPSGNSEKSSTSSTKQSRRTSSGSPERDKRRMECANTTDRPKTAGVKKKDTVEALLLAPSAKEKQTQKVTNEIMDLLRRPTAKDLQLLNQFRSDGSSMREFCSRGTKRECAKASEDSRPCTRLHFRKIIQKHTDFSLGDCSFLNTCFHMDTCKYIHYEVDYGDDKLRKKEDSGDGKHNSVPIAALSTSTDLATKQHIMLPPQWVQCDLRFLDLNILGTFSVVMADPPWDIHMELPYGTMSDDEMRRLNVQSLQTEGLIFLWVTGRAMELGRECLRLWGYRLCDEIIWVKTNQLQRIIRTGRTGHWINHGKEHCLVGVKGKMDKFHIGLDCDVIVAEVRATSHKPDEVYGLIERLSPGTRKIELFGRQHNAQPNWITLGNQLDGVRLVEPDIVARFNERYKDGNCWPTLEEVNELKKRKEQQQQRTGRGRGGMRNRRF